MTTDKRKVTLGLLLLALSTVVILATGFRATRVPIALAGLASIGMAVGALLVGLSEEDATV